MPSIGHLLLRSVLSITQGSRFSKTLAAARSPREAQSAALRRILAANTETAFGRRHGFDRIDTPAEYRRAVPVQTYEDIRDDIDAQELTGEPRLTAEPPTYYNRTSGTLGEPKNIPVTRSGLDRIRAHQKLSAYALSQRTRAMAGKVYAVTGAAVEGRMPGGTPFGSASGLLYESQPRLLRSRYVLPAELSAIEDYDRRYLAMAAFGAAEAGVTGAATANSSTLLRLLDVVNDHADTVLRAVADGRPPDGAGSCRALPPNPRRAARLRSVLDSSGRLTFADLWPGLCAVVTWTGGSCGVAIRNLRPALPPDCNIVELGYVASEVQGTLNVDPPRKRCLPTLQDTFFEFARREDWEAGGADMLGLSELEDGRDYYVIVTTSGGLYRYDMNDIVRVTGRIGETPTIEFVQKGKGVTSITGEKLYEAQVLEAVNGALERLRLAANFFVTLADTERASYTLYVEADLPGAELGRQLAEEVEARLRAANVEFDGKRASGRLEPLKLRGLRPGAGDSYRKQCVAAGQRDAQFKFLHLQYVEECRFDFDELVAQG